MARKQRINAPPVSRKFDEIAVFKLSQTVDPPIPILAGFTGYSGLRGYDDST